VLVVNSSLQSSSHDWSVCIRSQKTNQVSCRAVSRKNSGDFPQRRILQAQLKIENQKQRLWPELA
jgi:hypothetical protein